MALPPVLVQRSAEVLRTELVPSRRPLDMAVEQRGITEADNGDLGESIGLLVAAVAQTVCRIAVARLWFPRHGLDGSSPRADGPALGFVFLPTS